jgi:hypothetical protein
VIITWMLASSTRTTDASSCRIWRISNNCRLRRHSPATTRRLGRSIVTSGGDVQGDPWISC